MQIGLLKSIICYEIITTLKLIFFVCFLMCTNPLTNPSITPIIILSIFQLQWLIS